MLEPSLCSWPWDLSGLITSCPSPPLSCPSPALSCAGPARSWPSPLSWISPRSWPSPRSSPILPSPITSCPSLSCKRPPLSVPSPCSPRICGSNLRSSCRSSLILFACWRTILGSGTSLWHFMWEMSAAISRKCFRHDG